MVHCVFIVKCVDRIMKFLTSDVVKNLRIALSYLEFLMLIERMRVMMILKINNAVWFNYE